MKNMLVRIYSDRTEDVKIDELNKLLEMVNATFVM